MVRVVTYSIIGQSGRMRRICAAHYDHILMMRGARRCRQSVSTVMRGANVVGENPTRCTQPGQLICAVRSCDVLPAASLEGCIESSFGGLIAASLTWIYAYCRHPFGKIVIALALNPEYGSAPSRCRRPATSSSLSVEGSTCHRRSSRRAACRLGTLHRRLHR